MIGMLSNVLNLNIGKNVFLKKIWPVCSKYVLAVLGSTGSNITPDEMMNKWFCIIIFYKKANVSWNCISLKSYIFCKNKNLKTANTGSSIYPD